MFNRKKIFTKFVALVIVSGLTFTFNGCLKERPLPTDELITIYNSDMEKTNRMKPLDTMYVEVGGLKANAKHEIRILDSNKNLITSTQEYSNEEGVIKATPVWYDVGLKKPDKNNPTFHVDSGLEIKSFYINVVDKYDNGEDTNFEQPFFYVLKEKAENQEVEDVSTGNKIDISKYSRPKIYAATSTGEIENSFDEKNTKNMDGTISSLTKVYLKVEELPEKLYANDSDVTDIDIYIVPFGKAKIEDMNLSSESIIPKITKTRAELLNNLNMIWDINLTNPTNENNAYSIVLDIDRDGKFSKGVDINNDGLSDVFSDGVDGLYTAGFIVKNTPANDDFKFMMSDENGNLINSIPESNDQLNTKVYLSVENITLPNDKTTVEVVVSDNNVTIFRKNVDVKMPQNSDPVRFLKYIDKAKILDTANDTIDVNKSTTFTVSIEDINFSTKLEVYPIITQTKIITVVEVNNTITYVESNDTVEITSHTSKANANSGKIGTKFDETGTKNGDTSVWVKFSKGDMVSFYMYDHNRTWDENVTLDSSIINNKDVNISTDKIVKAFDFDSGEHIIKNPGKNGIFDIVVDYDNDGVFRPGTTDKILYITIRDTVANDIPEVGYINIASNGYFSFDNHRTDSNQTSKYGFIDEFYDDGSNTRRGKIRAIWNPYIKNKKRGGYYANYWRRNTDGNISVYVDENQEVHDSPFNFGQQIDLYIIDAKKYPLKRNMKLTGKDLRGEPQTITVQYSCSNGAAMQSILDKKDFKIGKYYVILDINRDGFLNDGIDYIDAVTQKGERITDENTDVVGFSIVEGTGSNKLEWVKQFGTTSSEYSSASAVDSNGDILTVGYTYGKLPDNNKTGNYDGFVAKYSKDGNKQWIKQFGTNRYDIVNGVTTIGTDIYVVGSTYGTFANEISKGSYDIFIAKFDKDGNQQWVKQFGTLRTDRAGGIATDGTSIYIAGYTYGQFENENNMGRYDGFVVKFDTDGNKKWVKQFGTSSSDYIKDISVNGTNIAVAGYTYGIFENNNKKGSYDGFVVKFDTNGDKKWVKQFGTSARDYIQGVTIDSNENIFVVGYTYGTFTNQTKKGGYDLFVVKYDASKNESVKQFGTSNYDIGTGIASDNKNGVYVTGYTYGSFSTAPKIGGYDGFVTKLDTDLFVIGSSQFGTYSTDMSYGVATDGTNLFVSGRTRASFSKTKSNGGYDIFVAKLKPISGN